MDQLERGSNQPRQAIDGIGLRKLAQSVAAEGIVQPLFVRKIGRGKFEIVAGERRWRAAKMAGLKKVPTVVRDIPDKTALAIALVENLHREDLNSLDQALAMQRLVDDFAMTHQQVAETIGRSRTTVTNLLRLLELQPSVREFVANGMLEMGHARALLALTGDEQTAAAEFAITERMSVRDVERMVKQSIANKEQEESSADPAVDTHTAIASTINSVGTHDAGAESEWFVNPLKQQLDYTVGLKRKHGRWCLSIDFSDLRQLQTKLKSVEDLVHGLEQASEPPA